MQKLPTALTTVKCVRLLTRSVSHSLTLTLSASHVCGLELLGCLAKAGCCLCIFSSLCMGLHDTLREIRRECIIFKLSVSVGEMMKMTMATTTKKKNMYLEADAK